MKFTYSPIRDKTIIDHENKMIELYTQIINNYAEAFHQYDCSLKVRLGWSNSFKNHSSSERISFENGYTCDIYCEVERDGKIIQYGDKDEEVDYFELLTYWNVSSITRSFCHLNVVLLDNRDDIDNEMNWLLKTLSTL